jgi:S-adenosylmethionine decarboxylase
MEDLRYKVGGSTVSKLAVNGVDTSFVSETSTTSGVATVQLENSQSVRLQLKSEEELKSTLTDFSTDCPPAPVGVHCILELYNCPTDLLNDIEFIKQTLEEAAKTAQSTLLDKIAHQFTPYGVTALALLAESHISIHTWPENGYIAADVFTCGEHAKPIEACEYLARSFKAGKHLLMKLPRGQFSPTSQPRVEIL